MKTRNSSISFALYFSSFALIMFTMLAYYKEFFYGNIMKDTNSAPLLLALGVPVFFATFALRSFLGTTDRTGNKLGLLLLANALILVFLGCVVPYRISLFTTTLFIQSSVRVAGYVNAGFSIILFALMGFSAFPLLTRTKNTSFDKSSGRIAFGAVLLFTGIICFVSPQISDRYGLSTLVTFLGVLSVILALVGVFLDKKDTASTS